MIVALLVSAFFILFVWLVFFQFKLIKFSIAWGVVSSLFFLHLLLIFLIVAYEQTIQQAFREVADGLVACLKTREVRAQDEELTAVAREYLRLSTMHYEGGVASYLEVLDADTRLFAAEIDLARARLAVLLSVVQVYRALGGGWQMAPIASSTAQPGGSKTAEEANRR